MTRYVQMHFATLCLSMSLISLPLIARADLLPGGIEGVMLGHSRTEALTNLVNSGVVPDMDKLQCTEKVPEKNNGLVDRICKFTMEPGSLYQGLPLSKVTFMLKDDAIVLVGAYVGNSQNTFATLRSSYQAQFGSAKDEGNNEVLTWTEASADVATRKTKIDLWADSPGAFVVYSYDDIK